VLVPAADPRALRDGLQNLLDDDSKRESLAARARERCEQRYDARLQLPALIEHFRNALEDDRA
jgi:glycosyltransferase involved in cell wall biosynthesis